MMKVLNLFLIFLIITSCSSFLSDDYTDVNYYSPKFLPSENKIVILKNIHKYTETGSPGGKNKDTKSSTWYIIQYDVKDETIFENKIVNFNIDPIWLKNGITSVSNSHAVIVSYDHTFLINLETNEKRELSNELNILNAYLDINGQNIILLKGFNSYSLSSYNINSQELNELIVLDDYFEGLTGSRGSGSNNFLLWYSYQQKIALVNIISSTVRIYFKPVNFACLYDTNKFALLETTGNLTFYKTSADSLVKEKFITLEKTNAQNFSLNSESTYVVYQANETIYLYDLRAQSEEVLLRSRHIEN